MSVISDPPAIKQYSMQMLATKKWWLLLFPLAALPSEDKDDLDRDAGKESGPPMDTSALLMMANSAYLLM